MTAASLTHLPLADEASDPRGRAARALHGAVEAVFAAALLFMPLASGAVEAWSQLPVLLALLVAAMLAAVARLLDAAGASAVGRVCLFPVAFIGLAAMQLIPWPAGLVTLLSPRTVALREELLEQPQLAPVAISLYPHATVSALLLVVAASCAMALVAAVFRSRRQIQRLLLLVTVAGTPAALMILGQRLAGVWLNHDADQAMLPAAGPFMNYNHLAQFLNLSLGAGLALLLMLLGTPHARRRAAVAAVTAMVILLTAGVFLSLSRGGILSMAAAGACVAIVLARRRSSRSVAWLVPAVALGAVALLPLAGFDAVFDRLASLGDLARADRGRVQIFKDLLPLCRSFPLLGTGLGTFEAVFPLYDRSGEMVLTTHAENEYAQILAETGAVGLALVLGFAATIARRGWRLVRGCDDWRGLAASGLGFALLAAAIHSFTDFGQHVMSNAMLSAVFCGLIVSMHSRGTAASRPAPLQALLPIVATVLAGAWLAWGGWNSWAAERHADRAMGLAAALESRNWDGNDLDYQQLIAAASAAARLSPRNIEYAYRLCEYRWRQVAGGRSLLAPSLRLDDASRRSAQQIVADLHRARQLCPTHAAALCLAGQIEWLALHQPGGGQHVRRAYALAPHDPTICFAAAMMDVQQGRWEQSLDKLRRLNAFCFRDLAQMYLSRAGRPDLAIRLAGDDVERLAYVASRLAEDPRHGPWTQQALSAARVACDRSPPPANVLASLARLCVATGQRQEGIEYYRRALAQDSGQVRWRLALARELADLGQTDAALREARLCLTVRPQMHDARTLIENLSARGGGRANP